MASAPRELIQRVPLFAGLDRNELERLARTFKERNFAEGETVATEGRAGVGFFVIESGQARVAVRGEERATLGPGDHFGEIALIDDNARRTATVSAATDLRCWGLTSWEFRPLVESNAGIAWKLLQEMARRLHAAEQRAG